MTSVQNHQQPSNGSKNLWVAVMLTLACISCGAFKSNSIDVEEYHDKEEKKEKTTKVIKKKENPDTKEKAEAKDLVEVVFHDETYYVPPVKKDFKIAVLLPFMGNSNNSPLTNPMLDFMEGVQIALENLNQRGLSMHVKVYDTYNDSLRIKNLLLLPEFQSYDLIIGPVFNEHIALMENHCAMYHIPLIVPLKYYGKNTKTNFPLFNVFPTDSIMYQELGRKVAKNFPNAKVNAVITSDAGSYLARKHFRLGYEMASKKTMGAVDVSKVGSVCNGDSVLLFVPTTSEAQMRICLNQLKKKKKVQVLGLKEWLDFTVIDYPIWNDLNVLYGTKYYVDNQDSMVQELRIKYRFKFKGEPSQYFYIAYDEMMFFGEALKAFGASFPNYIKNRNFTYLHNGFNFIEKNGYFENENINLIWFKDFVPTKVNE